jgi:hypothetical protein
MFGNKAAQRFWRWFEGERAQLEGLMRAAGEPGEAIDPAALGRHGEALSQQLAEFERCIGAEYALGRDGACIITFTAGGVEELFEDVFALVDASPNLSGWEFQALRARNAPRRFEAFGVGYDLSNLRFYYRLGSEKAVIAVLSDDSPACDYRTRRAFASALAAQLLGEEDYGRYVSDVLMLDYETWLGATPGGRSAPLAVLGPTFDRVFRRPRSLRRPAANMCLRLVS